MHSQPDQEVAQHHIENERLSHTSEDMPEELREVERKYQDIYVKIHDKARPNRFHDSLKCLEYLMDYRAQTRNNDAYRKTCMNGVCFNIASEIEWWLKVKEQLVHLEIQSLRFEFRHHSSTFLV